MKGRRSPGKKALSERAKHKELKGERLSRYVQSLFEKRGEEAFESARNAILEEANRLESKTIHDAFNYLLSYWTDTTRPALLSIACEAIGGDPGATKPIAVSLVLICEAVDLHDDIIDNSVTKGDHLTVYGKFGKEVAMLVGDALLFKGFALLYAIEKEMANTRMEAIIKTVRESFFELGDAEVLELSFKNRTDVRVEDYLAVVRKKAADVEAYLRISAIVGNASPEETEALAKYGRILGMLIILGDDNFDMLHPMEMVNRVENESLPLPMLYALQDPSLKARLAPILAKERISKKDANTILNLVYSAGIFDYVGTYLRKLINEGTESLKHIRNRESLRAIIESTYPE
jgi:octaprenyl-diphosphate synthase